jgi:hypothetical protein
MRTIENFGWQSSSLRKRALPPHYLNSLRQKRSANHKAIAYDLMSDVSCQFAIVECRAGLSSQDISGISGFNEHCLALALASLPVCTLHNAST